MRDADQIVHEAYGAGRWFPGSEGALRSTVESCLDVTVPPFDGRIVGGLAPHAGYVYSGGVAGHTFRALQQQATEHSVDTVVVLGFSHGYAPPGVSVLEADLFETPIGRTRINRDLGAELVTGSACIRFDSRPHRGEHSAENQVPFVQVALPEAQLVVALMGDANPETVDELVERLFILSQQAGLVVVGSTDMLHDPSYEKVTRTDRETLSLLTGLDHVGLRSAWGYDRQLVCGLGPVLTVMRYAERLGCREGMALSYRNSGDDFPESRGQWVVGYGSVVFVLTP